MGILVKGGEFCLKNGDFGLKLGNLGRKSVISVNSGAFGLPNGGFLV